MTMEYKKTINLLENTPNRPSKFRTKICVDMNDNVRGKYNINIQIEYNIAILKFSLHNFIGAYIPVK